MIMRKISILSLFAMGAMLFANCGGGSQSVTKGRQEITIPCQDQGRSDKTRVVLTRTTSAQVRLPRVQILTLPNKRLCSMQSKLWPRTSHRQSNRLPRTMPFGDLPKR